MSASERKSAYRTYKNYKQTRGDGHRDTGDAVERNGSSLLFGQSRDPIHDGRGKIAAEFRTFIAQSFLDKLRILISASAVFTFGNMRKERAAHIRRGGIVEDGVDIFFKIVASELHGRVSFLTFSLI